LPCRRIERRFVVLNASSSLPRIVSHSAIAWKVDKSRVRFPVFQSHVMDNLVCVMFERTIELDGQPSGAYKVKREVALLKETR
jgi:hypothetical protein